MMPFLGSSPSQLDCSLAAAPATVRRASSILPPLRSPSFLSVQSWLLAGYRSGDSSTRSLSGWVDPSSPNRSMHKIRCEIILEARKQRWQGGWLRGRHHACDAEQATNNGVLCAWCPRREVGLTGHTTEWRPGGASLARGVRDTAIRGGSSPMTRGSGNGHEVER